MLREEQGQRVLWMYSAKVGVIKKAAWNSEVRPQLEEMFQVDLDAPGLSEVIHERVGVLVWNSHFHPFADPVARGWQREQRLAFGRRFEFMHLDAIVSFVRVNRHQAPLRQALRAEGLIP